MLETLQLLHLLFFTGFFIVFWILEYIFPLRKKIWSTAKRWFHNISISTINTVFARVLFYITPVWMALYVWSNWMWLFNFIQINFYLELFISIILLDVFIYFQHVFSHKWKWLWRLHSIHHSDISLDVTTALRFHVLEIILSILFKIVLIFIFGFDAITVVTFEIILVSSAMFNHANLKLPKKLDRCLSYIFVTPEFHQVHHSIIHKETDSNYWFFLSIWDKIFGTYTFHKFKVKKIGLSENRDNLNLKDLLLLDIDKK